MKLKTLKCNSLKISGIIIALVSIGFIGSCEAQSSSKGRRIEFSSEFAPSEGLIKASENETRKEICLNGQWDLQPVYGPYNQEKTKPYGIDANEVAPDLPNQVDNRWEQKKVKIPSSWNSVDFFPSYNQEWKKAQMGWLKKKFTVPADWKGKRIIIQFQAVSGDSKVYLNGERIGSNFDSSTPFSFDITDKVKHGAENEILVGVRSQSLFNKQGTYGNITYAPGGGRMIGIWQDVFLVALPDLYVSDVYIKPEVSAHQLIAEITIKNTSNENRLINVNAKINEWINLAGHKVLTAPEIKWKLGAEVLKMNNRNVKIGAGKEVVVTLEVKINNELKYWDFDNPNLYGLTVNLEKDGQPIDHKYERFGWREYKIEGKKLMLNGKEIQLLGDSQHLYNETYMTRRFAWSWFKLLKDVGANSARLHAVVYPDYFHEMADEMGIAILPESSVYASSCNINYDSDLFWKSAKYNVEGMVKNYRNHPCVYGWSLENEVLPALNVKCNDLNYKKMVFDGMGELADICRKFDQTRQWISGDGSRDMEGRLPVYNVHYGSTTSYREESASTIKPFGVGEASIAYYSTPRQSEMYVGDRAYRSYKDHSDAIAVDVYELLKVQRETGTYCSVWNIGYYGVEELPFGLADLSKAATETDGVFLTANYVEGKPGVQIERIPPYSSQYNPGYDPNLPLYQPLPLYYAAKAAFHQPEPQACEWDHRQSYENPAAPVIDNPGKEVFFFGEEGSSLFFKLKNIGIPLVMKSSNSKILIIDCNSDALNINTKSEIERLVEAGSTAIFWGLTPGNKKKVESILPYSFEVFDRIATSVVPNENDNRVASISYKDLYFTENSDSKVIMNCALKGDFVTKGNVLLKASPVDWSQNNNGGMMRSERLNPDGPSFVEVTKNKGTYIASTINIDVVTPAHIRMISQLFRNLGVDMKQVSVRRGSLLDQTSVLVKTLFAGCYKSGSAEEALKTDFIGGETKVKPTLRLNSNECIWQVKETKNGLFNFNNTKLHNMPVENGAAYLSFWIQCPKPLNEIMTDPNVPEVGLNYSVNGGIKVWLNGDEKFESPKSVENGIISRLPLVKGWNHFLVKIVKTTDEWNFTCRLLSKDLELLSSMQSALNPYSEKANFSTIQHTDPEIIYDQNWGLQGDGWYESATSGAIAKFKFYGTGISLTGLVSSNGGKAKIYIDGKFDSVVDYKRDFRDPHFHYYTKLGLTNGEHEIKIEVIEGWVSVGPYEQWESYN